MLVGPQPGLLMPSEFRRRHSKYWEKQRHDHCIDFRSPSPGVGVGVCGKAGCSDPRQLGWLFCAPWWPVQRATQAGYQVG